MASTKLTNHSREQICREVLQHRFSAEVEKLIADRAAFADRVYNDVFSKSAREKMAALPDGWLPEESNIGVQFGSGSSFERLSFDGSFYGELRNAVKDDGAEKEAVHRRIPYRLRGCAKAYEPDHKLSVAFDALEARMKDLKKQFYEARATVNSALLNVTTLNKLVETWPEVAPFIARFNAAPVKLPAIPTDQLNKLLDLPVAA